MQWQSLVENQFEINYINLFSLHFALVLLDWQSLTYVAREMKMPKSDPYPPWESHHSGRHDSDLSTEKDKVRTESCFPFPHFSPPLCVSLCPHLSSAIPFFPHLFSFTTLEIGEPVVASRPSFTSAS